MSIRVAILTFVVAGLAIYAWRDWFKSLCGLILLMAVMEHPDMPKSILEDGVLGFLPKPYDVHDLPRAVQRYLGG